MLIGNYEFSNNYFVNRIRLFSCQKCTIYEKLTKQIFALIISKNCYITLCKLGDNVDNLVEKSRSPSFRGLFWGITFIFINIIFILKPDNCF